MDTSAKSVQQSRAENQAVDVRMMVEDIRRHMPETYQSIQRRAVGGAADTFALVRLALRGEPDCFYAIERGRVAGTPFALEGVTADVAAHMVQWGCTWVCIWPDATEATHGAH